LLYPKYLDAKILRGKTFPEGPAAKLLASGKPLTPETCGWHYVDGLTMPQGSVWRNVAIFWDKVGLGHNSERLPDGGHTVCFMGGDSRVINQADWRRFLADQEKAVAAIRRGEVPPGPWVPEYGE
jgi:hypothetical protein